MKSLRQIMDAANLFTDQGVVDRNFSVALCTLFGVWSLCCVILAGVYSSHILVAALANNRHLPYSDISTLARCIMEGRCVVITSTTSNAYFEQVANAQSGYMLELKRALQFSPPIVERRDQVVSSVVGNMSLQYVMRESQGSYAGLIQENPGCILDAAWVRQAAWFCIPFPKGSPFRKLFDSAIIGLRENGIIRKILEKYIGNHISAQNRFCKQQQVASKPMGLKVF
ncbi:MAG: hypothetical protein GY696_12695, partial [Gammaproteobacteria bacterium]|nr:hypothetical protein [Gammaproteobacteria bacterium]